MMLLRSEALIGAIYLWMPIDDPGPQQCDPVDSACPHQQAAARHAGSEAGVPRQPNARAGPRCVEPAVPPGPHAQPCIDAATGMRAAADSKHAECRLQSLVEDERPDPPRSGSVASGSNRGESESSLLELQLELRPGGHASRGSRVEPRPDPVDLSTCTCISRAGRVLPVR